MKKTTLALLLLTATSISYAKEKKVQHDAHEHGVAEMNVIWEKDELNIELLSPAFNITGFEHQPSNHEQEEAVEEIEKQLNLPNRLFEIKGASCKVENIKIESPFEDHHDHEEHATNDEHQHDKHDDDHKEHKSEDKHADHDDHKSEEKHADHDEHDDHDDHKEHKSEDKHADHDDHKSEEKHADHDEHDSHDDHKEHEAGDDHKSHDEHAKHNDHDDHAEESSTHSEYSISYEFHCEKSKTEMTIDTSNLFKQLPQMEKIKVQWLSATSQSSSLLTKESNTFTLK